MSERLKKWLIGIATVACVMGMVFALLTVVLIDPYVIEIGNNVEVRFKGRAFYSETGLVDTGKNGKAIPSTLGGEKNMFYGTEKSPFFTVVNPGAQIQKIKIVSFSAGDNPLLADADILPGKKFEFRIESSKPNEYWFCWINVVGS